MGLDLTLMPFDHDEPTLAFAHSMIECKRDRDLFYELLKLQPSAHMVPDCFVTFLGWCGDCGETRYGPTTETPYGDPLRCVRVDSLLGVPEHLWKQANLPALAYLRALDRARRVALYWH